MFSQGGFFMEVIFNFPINATGIISKQFLQLGLSDFSSAAKYIQLLPYKRNSAKDNVLCVFDDFGGTCSTKHALLKNFALENNCVELKLMLGIFRMNENNTPKISCVLKKYGLKEMPEAHNYLKYKNEIYDYTTKESNPEKFRNDLVEEIEIQSFRINDFKIKFHRNFLGNYLHNNPDINYSQEDFWQIREECIRALQHKKNLSK